MKQNRESTQVHTRKIDRAVSHTNMKRAKLRRVNKHSHSGPQYMRTRIDSYFAKHWRDTINVPTIDLRRKKHETATEN